MVSTALFRTLLLVVLVQLIEIGAIAAPAQPEIGDPTYGGTGCPNGSVGVVMSPDRRVVSFLFDQFSMETDKAPPKRKRGNNPNVGEVVRDTKKCEIILPLTVPAGLRARIATIELRGFQYLPVHAYSGILTQAGFFKDNKKDKNKKISSWLMYKGPLEQNFIAQTKYPRDGKRDWTDCGLGDDMEVITTAYVTNQNMSEGAMMSIDSADMVSEGRAVRVELEWERCGR